MWLPLLVRMVILAAVNMGMPGGAEFAFVSGTIVVARMLPVPVIDAIFVIDLVLKAATLRSPYLRGPWFLIDLLSSLPILGAMAAAPTVVQRLRFVRAFRFFRILPTLRLVRVLNVCLVAAGAAGDRGAGADAGVFAALRGGAAARGGDAGYGAGGRAVGLPLDAGEIVARRGAAGRDRPFGGRATRGALGGAPGARTGGDLA